MVAACNVTMFQMFSSFTVVSHGKMPIHFSARWDIHCFLCFAFYFIFSSLFFFSFVFFSSLLFSFLHFLSHSRGLILTVKYFIGKGNQCSRLGCR